MERFGRYVLLERIAVGGMAEVFRAAVVGTAGFTREVAVKRILLHLADQISYVTMFIDEAKLASSLHHPNILQVFELGRHERHYFLVMEYVTGCSLTAVAEAAREQQVRLPLPVCFHLASQVLEALAYAHAKRNLKGEPLGIIHRDVSPQNILVAHDGAVKLGDFGIAKTTIRRTETEDGAIKGKLGYMSPEQVDGRPVDPRSDLYSVGVILHELITAERMRRAVGDRRLMNEAAAGTYPRFDELGVDVPEQAAQVVYRALAPNPEDRFPDARGFLAAVRDMNVALGWHADQGDVTAVMHQLFPTEIAHEERTQAVLAQEMADLALDGQEPTRTIRRSLGGVTDPGQARPRVAPTTGTRVLPPPRRESRVSTAAVMGALVGLMGVAGVVSALVPSAVAVESHPARTPSATIGREHPDLPPVDVDIASTPPGAAVILDGEMVGFTPTRVRIYGDAPMVLMLSLPGYATVQQSLVPRRAPASLDFVLREAGPLSGAHPQGHTVLASARHEPTGMLTVQSRPWARLFIDGADTGRFTPVSQLVVAAGRHTLELRNDEQQVMGSVVVDVPENGAVMVSRELR
ncbi:MAG: serine/threonine-protein kinase [Myxococcota bacterium]